MTKRSGIGQFLLVNGVDLSGDIGSLSNVHGGPGPLEVTGIDKAAPERIGGVFDGGMDYMAWFDPALAHPALSALPTTDVHNLYGMASTLGAQAVAMVGKQMSYDPTRGQDGSLSMAVPNLASGYGVEMGELLTAGKRTDTAATNGASVDGAAATTTGWSAYLQVTAFTGTDVTVSLEDSANDTDFAAVTGGAFAQTTAIGAERIAGAAGATLRQYVRAVTTTSGGVTSVTFAVMVCRHPIGATA